MAQQARIAAERQRRRMEAQRQSRANNMRARVDLQEAARRRNQELKPSQAVPQAVAAKPPVIGVAAAGKPLAGGVRKRKAWRSRLTRRVPTRLGVQARPDGPRQQVPQGQAAAATQLQRLVRLAGSLEQRKQRKQRKQDELQRLARAKERLRTARQQRIGESPRPPGARRRAPGSRQAVQKQVHMRRLVRQGQLQQDAARRREQQRRAQAKMKLEAVRREKQGAAPAKAKARREEDKMRAAKESARRQRVAASKRRESQRREIQRQQIQRVAASKRLESQRREIQRREIQRVAASKRLESQRRESQRRESQRRVQVTVAAKQVAPQVAPRQQEALKAKRRPPVRGVAVPPRARARARRAMMPTQLRV